MSATNSTTTTLTATPTGTPTSNNTLSGTSSSTAPMASNTFPSGTFDGMTFTGVPLRTVFYFIAFMAVIMAIFYTIFIARRDRRRRVRDRARDTEAGRHTRTYRPETDEDSPPGYRSYMLDQPYVDPEMVVIYPQDAHFGQHLNALERHLTMENSLNNRPLVSSVTTTTTTTTLATFMPGASGGVRSEEDSEATTEPVFVARPEGLVATSSLTGSSAGTTSSTPTVYGSENSTPVIAEPAPTASFFSGRHLSILRFGLRGSNNIHSGSSSHRNSRHSETSSPSESRSPSPTLSSPRSSMALLVSEATGDNQPQMAEVTSSSSLPHPALHRLRSQGPPPYIPSTEEAPALPPSYNRAVEVPQ